MAACDQTADLQSLEIPVNKLSAMVVGHVIVDLGERDDASIDALPAKSNPEAPIIDLELRVADILQDVFSAAAVKTPSSDCLQRLLFDSFIKPLRPLIVVLLILTGIQLISTGLIGEMVMRVYFEGQKKPIYTIRELIE